MPRDLCARGPGLGVARASALAAFAALLLLGRPAEAGPRDACAEPGAAKLEGWAVAIRGSGPAKAEPMSTCISNVLVIKPASDASSAGLPARRNPGSLFSVRRD